MSLHFLGIRDFPILHRQFSSPTSKSLNSSDSTRDLAQDSKDVLVQRLHDLASRLVLDNKLKDEDITALHMDLDRMERVMKRRPRAYGHESSFEDKSGGTATPRELEESVWGHLSPSSRISMRFPDSPPRTAYSAARGISDMSPQKAMLLAQEAEHLLSQLSNTVCEMRARKEETEHIHDLLVTRAEKAAARIIELEVQLQEFDEGFGANQSEISYLRLRLRAIEVQGLQYIPFSADDELSQSIRNWKLDWADIDQRTKARRKKCKSSVSASDDSLTAVDAS